MSATGRNLIRWAACAAWACLAYSVVAEAPPATEGAATPSTSRPTGAPKGARVTAEGWFAPLTPKSPPPPLPPEISRAFVIPIHGEINDTLSDVIRRKVIRCRDREKAQMIVFDLDTPGGEQGAMNDIVRMILRDLAGVYSVAYVNPDAFSAGAIIALACNEIVLSPLAKMGASMPIFIGPGGIVELPEKVRGKFESADRTGMRTLAAQRGYDGLLCEAMVTLDIVVWLIRNPKTGELRFVDAAEWQGLSGAPPSTQPAAGTPRLPEEGWEYVREIDGPKELVSITADEAVFMGFSRHILGSLDALADHYRIRPAPTVLEDNWSEVLVGWLTSATVTSILLMAGIVLLYIEMHTPGFGVAGTLAVVCFVLLFGSRFLIGLANWWEIALFLIGLVLIAVEVFVTPGFGVMGVAGILCCVFALLAMAIPNAPDRLPIPDTRLDWEFFSSGVMALCIGFLGGLAACLLVARYLPKIPVASKLILPAAASVCEAPVPDGSPLRRIKVGAVGVVEAICRPVGKVRFGDDLFDAMADGDMIETGAVVRVVRKEGNRVVIERTA